MFSDMRWTSAAVSVAWGAAATVAAVPIVMSPQILQPWPQVTIALVLGVYGLALGAVVARRAPGNAASVLLAAGGVAILLTNSVTLGPLEGAWMLLYLPFALLMLVVPDGRAETRRWHAVGVVLCAVVALFIALVSLHWLVPATIAGTTPPAIALLLAFFALLVAAAAAPVVRYRRADERQRRQLRWVFLSGITLPLTLLLCWASYLLLGGPDLVGVGLVLMFIVIPGGVAIAIVRPDLFDIDRAAVASVTATALAMVVLVVLSAASAVVGVALVDWSPLAAITWTAGLTLLAVLAYPWVRRALDRLLYPERGRGLSALRHLSARVDAGLGEPEQVQNVLRVALRDPDLAIGYRSLSDGALLTLEGAPLVSHALATPLRVRGEEIGAIVPGPARASRIAAAVAAAAAPLVDIARVRAELARATGEVEASRQRILRAGYEERRRLERDLHDGAQQRLVALGMRLRVLQRTPAVDNAVSTSLDTVVAELGTAVAELRQIAHGVRPSALDDGLGAALADLRQRAPSTIEIDVRTPDLPDDIATTAYFVATEAVTNAMRHAQASCIRITVRGEGGVLYVRIDDDGRGGAALRPSGGLMGLADRVEGLGGRLTISSPAEAGTTVEASLPCAS